MKKSKKIVLYVFAVLIALVMMYEFDLDLIERALLIGFLLLLMVLFMVVFVKQEEIKKAEEKKRELVKRMIDVDLEDVVKKEDKECIYCGTTNTLQATYCKKCKMSMRNIVCPICQHENTYDQKYCEKCGSVLQNKKVHL